MGFRVRDAVLAEPPEPPAGLQSGDYLVSTIHRAENTDDPERLRAVISALSGLAAPVLLLAHPRLVARCHEFGISLDGGSLHTTDPLSYPDMVAAVLQSRGVVTDSGGLQKEAYLLQRNCTTVRTETEWVETLEGGWNVLTPDPAEVHEHALRPAPSAPPAQPYGDGRAGGRVVQALEDRRQ